jgi:hypothetical protein
MNGAAKYPEGRFEAIFASSRCFLSNSGSALPQNDLEFMGSR